MGNAKVSINFSSAKYSDADLSSKANFILDKMTGNANFATPVPPLADLKAANDLYIVSLGKAEYGSKEDTVIKNNNRTALSNVLKALGNYVQTTSGGDEAIILSSGYDVNKKPSSVGQLDKPENFNVKPGGYKGTMLVNCDVVEFASFYEFEYTEFPSSNDSKWIQKTSTKRRLLIEGLSSGKQYTFRVAGAGSHPSRIWSDEVSSFVL